MIPTFLGRRLLVVVTCCSVFLPFFLILTTVRLLFLECLVDHFLDIFAIGSSRRCRQFIMWKTWGTSSLVDLFFVTFSYPQNVQAVIFRFPSAYVGL
ncbi:hypothetical protein IV203_002632 [Nitzschia inconspicua]|uniref:Uncharacterized protein n=1 Tax=Nitzschia inconspicua TaxID=303405 RepID=A0A9K3K787_9STRA|nr:hypothetical protein IV203_002632 [Nitzschia inconspicua]